MEGMLKGRYYSLQSHTFFVLYNTGNVLLEKKARNIKLLLPGRPLAVNIELEWTIIGENRKWIEGWYSNTITIP